MASMSALERGRFPLQVIVSREIPRFARILDLALQFNVPPLHPRLPY